MGFLSANRTTGRGKIVAGDLSVVIENGTKVYAGGLAVINPGGGLEPANWLLASRTFGGVVIRNPQDQNIPPAVLAGDGALTGTIRRTGTWSFAKTSSAIGDLGKLAYAVDDQTVAVSAGTNNAYIVGQIIRIIDSSTVEVDMTVRSA